MFTKKNNPKESQLNVQILEERFAYETRYLKKYFKINESSVKKHKEQIEISLLKEIKENPDKESQLNDFYENEIRIITSFYYHSSVVLVYTILENSLTQIVSCFLEPYQKSLPTIDAYSILQNHN